MSGTMRKSDALAAMRKAPMFSALKPRVAQVLLDRGQLLRLRPGETVFEAGSLADRFFTVLAGCVKVFKISASGDEHILHIYGAGVTFGEAAMWAGGRFPAYAEAIEDSHILVISQKALRQALADPDLSMGIMAGLSAKLREFVTMIEKLSMKDVPARLAEALLSEARQAGANTFRLRQTKRELASHLGTIPETLSRALAKFKAAKLITVKGAQITLLKPDGLRDISE